MQAYANAASCSTATTFFFFVGAISKGTSPFCFVHNYFTILSPAAFAHWLKVLSSHVWAVMEHPELLIKHVSTPEKKGRLHNASFPAEIWRDELGGAGFVHGGGV